MANELLVGGPTTDNKVDLVMSRYRTSANHHTTHFRRVKTYYDLFRAGAIKRNYQQFRNNVQIPFAITIIEADVSLKALTSFGTWPPVEFIGFSPEDAPSAEKNKILIGAQMRDCDSFIKAVDFFTSADIYGLAIARAGWTNRVEKTKYREPNQILGIEEIKTKTVTTFDGPDWEVLDILDCFPEPNQRTIKDAAWFIYRYYLDYDELLRRATLGTYDLSAVRELAKDGITSESEGEMKERLTYYRSLQDYEARSRTKYARPVEIIEYWGHVPNEFAPDGVINRVLSVANGKKLLRDYPCPIWNQRKPFFNYSPIPDPHYLHGIGKLEPIAKMGITASKLASQKLDALELAMSPTTLTTSNSGLDKKNLILAPGKVITLESPSVSEDQVRQLSFDLRGVQGSYGEIEQLWRWSQYAAGVLESVTLGAPGPDRETRAGFIGRAQAAGNRPTLESMLAEHGFVEPLADYFRSLNAQFLKLPHTVKMLGSSATIDPITGFPLPPEPVEVDWNDVNMDYRARAVGSLQSLSRTMRRQDMLALLQATAANPVAMQLINWAAFYKQLFSVFDIANVDSLFNTRPTALGMSAGDTGMTATGAPPEMGQMLTASNLGG